MDNYVHKKTHILWSKKHHIDIAQVIMEYAFANCAWAMHRPSSTEQALEVWPVERTTGGHALLDQSHLTVRALGELIGTGKAG